MTKRRKKQSNGPVWALLMVGLLGAGALAYYVKQTPKLEEPRPRQPSVELTRRDPPPRSPSAQDLKVVVFRPRMNGLDLSFDRVPTPVPQGQDPRVFAVNAFLASSKITGPDARAIAVQVKDGLAMMDFTPSFDQTYGTTDEKTLLDGLLTTLGQFPEIQRVQILVNGSPIETFGSVELGDPMDVIRSELPQAN